MYSNAICRSLIQILDPELFELMDKNRDYTHFFFCYRWFLLDFKRGNDYNLSIYFYNFIANMSFFILNNERRIIVVFQNYYTMTYLSYGKRFGQQSLSPRRIFIYFLPQLWLKHTEILLSEIKWNLLRLLNFLMVSHLIYVQFLISVNLQTIRLHQSRNLKKNSLNRKTIREQLNVRNT